MSPRSISGVQNLFSQDELFFVEINKIAHFQFWGTFTLGLSNMVFFQTGCQACLLAVYHRLLAFHTGEVCDIILLVRRNKKRAVASKSREIYLLNRVQKTGQTYAVPEREGGGRCKAALINYIVK